MRSSATGSGDERTSLSRELISKHRPIPNDPGPRLAGSDEKDAYVVAVPPGCSGAGSRHVRCVSEHLGVQTGREVERAYRAIDRPHGMCFSSMR
jgi:hypothetical protein